MVLSLYHVPNSWHRTGIGKLAGDMVFKKQNNPLVVNKENIGLNEYIENIPLMQSFDL